MCPFTSCSKALRNSSDCSGIRSSNEAQNSVHSVSVWPGEESCVRGCGVGPKLYLEEVSFITLRSPPAGSLTTDISRALTIPTYSDRRSSSYAGENSLTGLDVHGWVDLSDWLPGMGSPSVSEIRAMVTVSTNSSAVSA